MADDQKLLTAPDAKLLAAIRKSSAASLAGGIIAASGRAHSVEEAVGVLNEVQKAMFPGGPTRRGRRALAR
jgi:hypothetical protein